MYTRTKNIFKVGSHDKSNFPIIKVILPCSFEPQAGKVDGLMLPNQLKESNTVRKEVKRKRFKLPNCR